MRECIHGIKPGNTEYYFPWEGPEEIPFTKGHQECTGKREPASPRSSVAALLCSPGLMSQRWAINIHRDDGA